MHIDFSACTIICFEMGSINYTTNIMMKKEYTSCLLETKR